MQTLSLGNKKLEVPIIQGGMGIGISLDGLAGAVAACGGMGVISSAYAGIKARDFWENPKAVSLREIPYLIASAKEKARGKGLIGVNIMVAVEDYADHVQAAIKGGADAIISGAGLPLDLPDLAKGKDILLAPIVSSGRVANLICKAWQRRHHRLPDFMVIEGAAAGGHLGFAYQDLQEGSCQSNDDILSEVLDVIKVYEKEGKKIPVFMAGGICDKADMDHALAQGASGVQIGTPFIVTEECDADQTFKEVILQAKEEDIVLTESPVGMPGRAVATPLVKAVSQGKRIAPRQCRNCLKPCDSQTTAYCISEALIAAAQGDVEHGLFFCGSNGARLNTMTTVPKLIAELSGNEGVLCD